VLRRARAGGPADTRSDNDDLGKCIALVKTLDARDRYTAGHCAAVAVYSRDIARRLGLAPAAQERVFRAGLVHDIGKIGLPGLERQGRLTPEEQREHDGHMLIGDRILAAAGLTDLAAIIRFQNEHFDGSGGPDALAGVEIPLESRIIAVASAYNDLTSDKPGTDATPSRVARSQLAEEAGLRFDPDVVAAFEQILGEAAESDRSGLAIRVPPSELGGGDMAQEWSRTHSVVIYRPEVGPQRDEHD
jgi:HD-GYP domain-containing protein (c-di-GMP phosphodiesterase class II)